MLMGSVVVNDQMHVKMRGSLSVNEVEELDPLLMTVPLHTGGNDMPFSHVDGREQGGRSIALVVMRHSAATALLDGQARLAAAQCLNLALLIGAQNKRVFRRVQIQAHDIEQLLLEMRVVTYLECLDQMRL